MARKINPGDLEKQAVARIIGGEMDDVCVRGVLKIASPTLERLPSRIEAAGLDVSGCPRLRELPAELKVRSLNISRCRHIENWPEHLDVYEFLAVETPLRTISAQWRIRSRADFSHCSQLEALPDNFQTGTLVLSGCTALERLPEGLSVYFLDLAGCTQLAQWPERASLQAGRLDISGCTRLKSLPPWLHDVAQLNVNHCSNLTRLPEGLQVSSWLEVADCPLQELPTSLQNVALRWRGVPVDARVVFEPDSITANEVLSERNAEKRRVMLERMGYEKFLLEAKAQTLDSDQDPGGARRLLRVEWQDDEPLVCLAVYCPSTGRQYMLRVPPRTSSCHAAAAWIAGFDNPNDYRPLIET